MSFCLNKDNKGKQTVKLHISYMLRLDSIQVLQHSKHDSIF